MAYRLNPNMISEEAKTETTRTHAGPIGDERFRHRRRPDNRTYYRAPSAPVPLDFRHSLEGSIHFQKIALQLEDTPARRKLIKRMEARLEDTSPLSKEEYDSFKL
ncbi:hypothetical protein KKC94_04485 [Patescibacteria group bacterium]|nr:hypothetical protein [Patescibacteria group bacterium]